MILSDLIYDGPDIDCDIVILDNDGMTVSYSCIGKGAYHRASAALLDRRIKSIDIKEVSVDGEKTIALVATLS